MILGSIRPKIVLGTTALVAAFLVLAPTVPLEAALPSAAAIAVIALVIGRPGASRERPTVPVATPSRRKATERGAGRIEDPPAIEDVPAALPAKPASDPAPRETDPTWRNRQRILVAEDNPLNQKTMELVLRRAGWRHALAAMPICSMVTCFRGTC